MNGLERISAAFSRAKTEQRAALMPYFTLGFPTPDESLRVIKAIGRAGADLIELGVPFSDPLADGPTIQHSTQVALANGITLGRCLEMAAQLRAEEVAQPLLLMGYTNPILAYGVRRFVSDAEQAGADRFILPDLPPEEAGELEQACREAQMALVYLAAPTSTPERLKLIAAHTTGFLYLVSLTGVTGARSHLAPDLEQFILRARNVTRLPLAVGFGISTPNQAQQVGRLGEGVIVGSALIQAVAQSTCPDQTAAAFIGSLREAVSAEEENR